VAFIPHIKFVFDISSLPFKFARKQFSFAVDLCHDY
jgi:hypothetical protein